MERKSNFSETVNKMLISQFRFFKLDSLKRLLLSPSVVVFRDQSLTDIMPLYRTMKKATFSDSEDEVRSSAAC